jgi:hypothetical protein
VLTNINSVATLSLDRTNQRARVAPTTAEVDSFDFGKKKKRNKKMQQPTVVDGDVDKVLA